MYASPQTGITGFVVGFNEEHLLRQCLSHLQGLNELLYIDLNSSDESVKVAENLGASVICHDRVPVVEIIHAELLPICKCDWMLITDPDEVVDIFLKNQLIEIAANNPSDIGIVTAPWLFYFKKHPLKGTLWGGNNSRVILINKNRVEFSAHVHRGRNLKPGFKLYNIEKEGDNIIHHYWMTSYAQLFEKHRRYIKREGESMYANGYRASFLGLLKAPLSGFKECFFTKKGYKDGLVGFNLSIFWAWYKTSAYLSLRSYERKQN